MFGLKLIPKLAHLLSAPSLPQELSSLECLHFRWIATSSQGVGVRGGEGASRGGRHGAIKGSGNRKSDDLTTSLKQKQAVSDEHILERFMRYDEDQGAQRELNRDESRFGGPSNSVGLAGRVNPVNGNSAGHRSHAVSGLDRSKWAENNGQVEGYRNRQFIGHDKGESLDKLENFDQTRIRNRENGSYMKGQAVSGLSHREGPDTEDETDEEELKAISTMDNEEFEKHLRRKEKGKASKVQDMVRSDALGEKCFDKGQKVEDVKSVASPEKEMADQWKQEKTLKKPPKEYHVCKGRIHSILWECEKRKLGLDEKSSEEDNGGYMDNLVFDSDGEVTPPLHLGNDNRDSLRNSKVNYKIEPKHWEGSVQPESIEGTSAKEERMMLEEFGRRMEYNRIQVAAFVKQHLYSRRRPVEGWNYIVDKFGSEGKIGKSDGKHGKLNDFEKPTSKRESIRSRLKIL